MLGPATCAIETVSCSFELPSIRSSRWTSAGRYDWYATSKKTVKIPIDELEHEQLPHPERVEATRAAGSARRIAARARSPTIRIGRRRRRSTQTPAGSAKRMNGRKPSIAEQRELERARVQADGGEPRDRELGDLCAELADRLPGPQLQEVGVLQSPPVGRRSLRIGGPAVERRGEAVRLALGVVGGEEVVDRASRAGARSVARRRRSVARAGRRRSSGRRRRWEASPRRRYGGKPPRRSRRPRRRIVGALEEEEARGAAVELLGDRAHLPRPHDLNEPGLLQHLHVVAHGSLRQAELLCELGHRVGAVAEQDDDLRAEVVPERLSCSGSRTTSTSSAS